MAKDKEPTESLTGMAKRTADQITGQTQEATENYFRWFQTTMSASPWSNTELNKKLLSYATENVSAAFGFVQKLSQAKNLEDVVKIQTEFMTANEFVQRAGKEYRRDLYQDGGCDESPVWSVYVIACTNMKATNVVDRFFWRRPHPKLYSRERQSWKTRTKTKNNFLKIWAQPRKRQCERFVALRKTITA